MPYTTAIDAIKTLLIGGDLGLGTDDVSDEADYDILNTSHQYGAVVLDYAGMSGERAELAASFYHVWLIQATLAVVYESPSQAHTDMAALRQEVLDELGDTPALGIASNLYQSVVVEGRAMDNQFQNEVGLVWQIETLVVEVRELHEY